MKFIFLFLTLFFCGCQNVPPTTYVPPPIVEKEPSWDGDKQNSGLIEYIDGRGFLITPKAAIRYTSLTEKFGSKITPPISAGEGLIPYQGNFLLSPEYMSVFMEVSTLNKQ